MTEPNWSASQQAIFAYIAKDILALTHYLRELGLDVTMDPNGHLIIRARAGTGKTTTILNAIRFATEDDILLCAFNKDIADELRNRCKAFNPRSDAKTLHGVGYALIREFLGHLPVDAKVRSRALTEMAIGEGLRLPLDVLRDITKAHQLGREVLPLADQTGDLIDLIYEFDCVPDEKWRAQGWTAHYVEQVALKAMRIAATDMNLIKRTGIDYSDMLYLPIRNQYMAGLYDLVLVDEAQDMTTSQLTLAQGVCRPGGRVVVVGDDRQAIYGFRGADSEALDRLKDVLHANELGLTTTYRCGTIIAEFAAQIVPDFKSGAPHTGAIEHLNGIHAMTTLAEPGDFILSRKNAPLGGTILKLLLAGKRAYIRGKNYGDRLIKIVERVAKRGDPNSIEDFLTNLNVWRDKEIKKALADDKEERVDEIRDQADTISALSEGMVTVPELVARLHALFQDDGHGDAGRITLSSIHKAKGLEAKRVFVLTDTLYPKLPRRLCTPARMKEEANLAYVAYTRAKETLVLVRTENIPDTALPVAASDAIHEAAQAEVAGLLPPEPDQQHMIGVDVGSVIEQLDTYKTVAAAYPHDERNPSKSFEEHRRAIDTPGLFGRKDGAQ